MFEALLVTTSSEGLQPLGSAAQRSFELVSSVVRDRLGPEHAAIFGEPVAAQHGDSIDWYAPLRGQATALADLAGDDQDRLRARLGQLVGDIRDEAQRLAASPSAEDRRLSEALSNAIEVPAQNMVFGLRDESGELHPVLVHWAWIRNEQRAVRGVLSAMVPRPEPVAIAAAPVAAPPSSAWWWLILLGWLLLALMIGAILYLLIVPCGVNTGRLIFCPADEPEIEAVMTEGRVASDEIASLERELALARRQCQPTVPVLPVTPAPDKEGSAAPAAPDDAARRADVEKKITDRGGARGALNFTLEWGTIDDVDLSVTCPTGVTISYRNKGDCNGTLDLDANVVRAGAVTDPVENIVFQDSPLGLYKVRVHLRSERTDGPKEVILHVLRRDGPSQTYKGMVSRDKRDWITNISISR